MKYKDLNNCFLNTKDFQLYSQQQKRNHIKVFIISPLPLRMTKVFVGLRAHSQALRVIGIREPSRHRN